MDYGEYLVTVRGRDGDTARLVVHAHSDAIAREMAKQATGLQVVAVKRVS